MTFAKAPWARLGLVIGLGLAATGATCIQPQSAERAGSSLSKRVSNAEKLSVQNAKQLEALGQEVRGGANASAETEALREEVRRLRGQLEDGLFRLDQRLSRLEGRAPAPGPGPASRPATSTPVGSGPSPAPDEEVLPSAPPKPAPAAPKPEAPEAPGKKTWASADDAFSDGQTRFRAADFAGARQSFTELLAQFPESPHSAAGLYWLGESHFALKEYSKAIVKFDQVVKKYPKSKWAAPALLKTGYAFLALKQPGDAKLFFREVLKQFPESEEARTARKELEASGDEKKP